MLVFDVLCGYYHCTFDAERHQIKSVKTLGQCGPTEPETSNMPQPIHRRRAR